MNYVNYVCLIRRMALFLPLLCLSQIAQAAPEVSVSASPSSVALGQTARITWNSSGASSCRATGDWTGSLSVDGSKISAKLTQNKRYQFWILCEDSRGQRAEDVAYVQAGNGGSSSSESSGSTSAGTMTASPSSVALGGRTTVSWNFPGARNCRATGDWSGSRASSGSLQTSALSSSKRYQFWMICTAADGSRLEKVAYVQAGGSASSGSGSTSGTSGSGDLNLTASASSVSLGNSVTLRWSAPSGSSCKATGDWSGSKSSSGSASSGSLTQSRRYQFWMICNHSSGRYEDVVYVQAGGSSGTSASGSESTASSGSTGLNANPASVSTGGRTTLSWNFPGARNCRANGDWSGSRASSGSLQTSALTSNRRYQFWMLCTAADGSRLEKVAYVQVGGSSSSGFQHKLWRIDLIRL